MDVYIAVNLLILFFAGLMPVLGGVLFERGKPYDRYTRFLSNVGFRKKDPSNNLLFLTLCFILIMFVTVYRAPTNGMSVDYPTYVDMSSYVNSHGLDGISSNSSIQIEEGLARLLYIGSNLSEGTIVAFIAMTTAIALLAYFRRYCKDSPIVWFSVFALITFGSYYVIFNGIAQATAVAIAFLGAGYIYNKKRSLSGFAKYSLIILAAALVHKTAIIMLPMYFLLTYRFKNRRRDILLFLVAVIVVLGMMVYLDDIVTVGINEFFPEYQNHLAEGISWLQAGSIIAIIRPVILGAFLYINRRYIDWKNKLDVVAINSTVIFFVINLLSLQTQVIQRFSYFFIPVALLIVPLVISRMDRKKARFWTILMVVIFMVFSIASLAVTGDSQFKFIWSSND